MAFDEGQTAEGMSVMA